MPFGKNAEKIAMNNAAWHQRFVLQSFWTKALRTYLYKKLNLDSTSRILDVGSGTGALLAENIAITTHTYGVDFDHQRNLHAKMLSPLTKMTTADAYHLPWPKETFDLCFCHYLLLWIKNPVEVLKEMQRVTRPGGFVIAFAEPDYLSRIDTPEVFQKIAGYQNESLKKQGVRLDTGRQLLTYFLQAGFRNAEMGMLSGEWNAMNPSDFSIEWEIISYDLKKVLTSREIEKVKQKAFDIYSQGGALSFIPTFYAWASV